SADLFNLLCIPPLSSTTDVLPATWAAATSYCQTRRAMVIIDPPAFWTANPSTAVTTAETGVSSFRATVGNDEARNAVMYFPRLRHPMGGLRAARRAALGADPAQCRRLHADPLSAGRLPGPQPARGLSRRMRSRDHDPDPHHFGDR